MYSCVNTIFTLMKGNNKTEGRIQSDCFLWLWNGYPKTRGLLYHIANGGYRTPVEAMRFKAMGVVPGMPDLHLAISSDNYGQRFHSLYIEMKTDKGKESPEQIKVHTALRKAGNMVATVRTLEEFQELIKTYLMYSDYLIN